MAFIDFNFIWSGHYAKLKDPTKILLYVIAGVCNHTTGEFYHGVPTLAHLAGISERSTQYALRELETHDPPIISSEPRPGKPANKTHLPTAKFTQDKFSQKRGAPHAPGGAPHAPVPVHHMHPNNRGTTTDKTTTAANQISPALIADMTELYGEKRVLNVVVSMRSMNGEVKNANAYFRVCCERGWIPTSRKAKERQETASAITELENELERVQGTPAAEFERPAHFGIPQTPEEVKAETISKLQESVQRLRSKEE